MGRHIVCADWGKRTDRTVATIARLDVVTDSDGVIQFDDRGNAFLRAVVVYCKPQSRLPYPNARKYIARILQDDRFDDPPFIHDGGGVGVSVHDEFNDMKLASKVVSVTATCGNSITRNTLESGWVFNCAKALSVRNANTLIQLERIKILPGLPYAKEIIDECLNYQLKQTGLDTQEYNAISGKHDDCVQTLLLIAFFLFAPHLRSLRQDMTASFANLDTIDAHRHAATEQAWANEKRKGRSFLRGPSFDDLSDDEREERRFGSGPAY